MGSTMTPSRLRENLYRILDQILETGEPVEILRNGKKLKIIPERPRSLEQLQQHSEYLNVEKEEIVHIDWSSEWRP